MKEAQTRVNLGGIAVAPWAAHVNTSLIEPTPAIDILHEPTSFVRWTFLRRGRMITCEITVNGSHSYDVCVITHWNVALSVIEDYGNPASALSRHAEIVSGLHEAGWVRISEMAEGDRPSA